MPAGSATSGKAAGGHTVARRATSRSSRSVSCALRLVADLVRAGSCRAAAGSAPAWWPAGRRRGPRRTARLPCAARPAPGSSSRIAAGTVERSSPSPAAGVVAAPIRLLSGRRPGEVDIAGPAGTELNPGCRRRAGSAVRPRRAGRCRGSGASAAAEGEGAAEVGLIGTGVPARDLQGACRSCRPGRWPRSSRGRRRRRRPARAAESRSTSSSFGGRA